MERVATVVGASVSNEESQKRESAVEIERLETVIAAKQKQVERLTAFIEHGGAYGNMSTSETVSNDSLRTALKSSNGSWNQQAGWILPILAWQRIQFMPAMNGIVAGSPR